MKAALATRRVRIGAAIVALSAWAAELLFLASHWKASASPAHSLWLVAAYLTDWSNLLVALVCTATALGASRMTSPFWRLIAATAIIVVGLTFAGIGGWAAIGKQPASSILAHVVTPALMSLWWLAIHPHGGLRWPDALGTMLFPAAYLTAMFGRGLLGGGYPYPEVDVSRAGWLGALTFSGGVALVFLLIAALLVLVDRLLSRTAERRLA